MADKILILGSEGQIGTVLRDALTNTYGVDNVITSDVKPSPNSPNRHKIVDVTDSNRIFEIVKKYEINQIYLLAALLSATGEKIPTKAWDVNMKGMMNVLEISRQERIGKVYFPSSIAVFGGVTPKINTPQDTILQPQSMYGITKLAGEHLGNYYFQKYGLDVRSIRYPGIISHQSKPGGGTTDYAVDIFYHAIESEKYTCFLKSDSMLPMMYMDDAVKATLQLMEAPADCISIRQSYNVSAMSFTPSMLAKEIQKHLPAFTINYEPDFRQDIADTWVRSMDDSQARVDWGWSESFDLAAMTKDMINNLTKKLTKS